MVAKWPNNKNLPVSNDEIEITDANVISSVQIAALNETTDRATSKPKAVIDGQDATGGGGTTTPHALGTNVDTTTGPFLSQHADNVTKFTDLYNNNTAKFPAYNTVEEFLNVVLGSPLNETIDVACVYIPNATSTTTGGVWPDWSEQVNWKQFGAPMGPQSKYTKKWFIPEAMFLAIIQNHDASLDSMTAFKALSESDQWAILSDKSVMNDYLPSSENDTYELRQLNASTGMGGGNQIIMGLGKGSKRIAGTAQLPSELDLTDADKWWTTVQEYLVTMASFNQNGRVTPDGPCIAGGHDKTVGFKIESTNQITHGTPMVVADDKIEVDSSVLDADNLPAPAQFTVDVPWDPVLLSNLATIFADPNDYTLLSGDIKVEVLKAAVTTAAGADAPPGIVTHADKRPVELDGNGAPEENQYDEESVIPAINRVHKKTNQALGSAGQLDQYLTTTVIGNPNASRAHSPGDTTYEALTAAGYDPTLTIALGRLNLIPILSGDRLIESVPKLDSDGNQVYTDLGIPETTFITQEQRAEMSPQARRDRFMLHPDSDKPPTKMLEALWTNWRHLSALTTDTYGISALTDVDIIDDKHELIEPLELNSFIQNFNLLYNMTDSLSADLGPIKRALSGEAPGDTLIAELSAYSVYHNLNTIYTGMSANSACCETNTLSTFNNRTDIDLLSAFAIDIDNRLGQGGGGGITVCEGQDICSVLTNLHDTIVNLDDPGGFTIDHPASFPKNFTPDRVWEPVDANDPCIGTVNPDSDVYRYYDKQEGQPEQEIFLWQHVDNSWYIGDVCDMTNGQQIENPLNLPLSALSHNNKQIIKIDSPYKEFTEKINKVIEYVDQPPIVRNPVGRKDPVDIDALSACCDTNTLSLSALSAYVGGPATKLRDPLKPFGNITSIVNHLSTLIEALDEAGVPSWVEQTFAEHLVNININRSNITTLSGDLSALEMNVDILSGNVNMLSGDVIDLTNTVNTNIDNIAINTNNINILSGDVEDLKECCDDSMKLDDLGMHAVLLTGAQSISGEKLFKDTLTVETTAVIGENVTVGEGDTVFSVCADENGMNHVILHEIIVDPADMSVLPDGAIYALEVTDPRDGIGLIKQLYVK